MRGVLDVITSYGLMLLGTASDLQKPDIDSLCKGYSVSQVVEKGFTLSANLDLIGKGCEVYGSDVKKLRLFVDYETEDRLHVLIEDRESKRYHVPEEVVPRPTISHSTALSESQLEFSYTETPFSFKIVRKSSGDVLFNTNSTALVFERQFLRVRTSLPDDPNLYGLGEHTDPFRLKTKGYTRTFWSHDAGAVPEGHNLYGNHPIYYEHRKSGSHGVFLLNSNGMDIHVDKDQKGASYLEYNALGGVLDFYFLAGPTPKEVARQYADVVGLPAMVPYWSLGFHNCRYGYQDWFDVAEAVYNYSEAGIPLETMWTDIDYMDRRRVFTLDPERFPFPYVRSLVEWLHSRQQHYIVMVDPAVGAMDYPAYTAGEKMGIFLKNEDGSFFKGVVWPGPTVYPDWFHPDIQEYWNGEFHRLFDPHHGVDLDGVWIDMNEPANFCRFPCKDPVEEARRQGNPPAAPPVRTPPRTIPGFPYPKKTHGSSEGEPFSSHVELQEQASLAGQGHYEPSPNVDIDHSSDNLLYPEYHIANRAGDGSLSDMSSRTDLKHANGQWEYDVHNIYGTMMSMRTREAMKARKPGLRPFIITRSTFAGAGRYVQKWLGDNVANWHHYRRSIAGILNMNSIFQVPMAGADVCGFIGTTTETLCARWTTLGAFSPFFRNHNDLGFKSQEFYRWPLVTSAAKYAIGVRYQLLDYFYTALMKQTTDGTPSLNPLWFLYPRDEKTFPIDLQYFYGDCILISPVTDQDSTSVTIYLPDDIFYAWDDHKPVRGKGSWTTLKDIPLDRIPIHIRGGCVIPIRVESANTTTELREKEIELLVAPGLDGTASGSLYLDDGVSEDGGPHKTEVAYRYEDGELKETVLMGLGLQTQQVTKVTVLGGQDATNDGPWRDELK